jgi:hypothetical protein
MFEEHRVHPFWGSDDGIDRTSLDAERAADAPILVDQRSRARLLHSKRWIQRLGGTPQERCQHRDSRRAARRTLVDVCLARCDGLGIRTARGVAALRALRLRQQCVYLVDQIRNHGRRVLRTRLYSGRCGAPLEVHQTAIDPLTGELFLHRVLRQPRR